MWISAGDHDVTDNIVHLVLAKVPDSDGRPIEGTRGISLFIVPKILPDGTINDVAVAVSTIRWAIAASELRAELRRGAQPARG